MPKPSTRLVLLSLLPLPAALLAGTGEVALTLCLVLYLLFVVMALVDILLSGQKPHPSFQCDRQIRQAKNSTGSFNLVMAFADGDRLPPWIEVGIPFPLPVTSTEEQQRLMLKADTPRFSSKWEFSSPDRGYFKIDRIYWQIPSLLGLWLRRGSSEADLPIRIYPNLHRDKKTLANLFLNRGLAGMNIQRMSGQGRDYDQIRDYEPGDPFVNIHWKASAKRNNLMTKTYQVERTQEIYVLIDHSRLSARKIRTDYDEHDENVLERFVAAASVLSLAAVRQGDLFGLMTFSRDTTGFLRASSGPAHLRCVQDHLFTIKPNKVFPDFEEMFRFVRTNLRRRSLIILLTDLSDPAAFESFRQHVGLISRRHILLVNMLTMAGVGPLFQRGDDRKDDIYTRLAGHLIWKDLHDYTRLLAAQRVDLRLLKSENLALEVVNQYLTVKKRQLI
ncbi:DUF58 domain-containing protein [Ruficoccus sp. ZRK36]|uniref:DUF58 domain-containing protein n=1 Tax=Ruficoccus sp. ZRK36 TaxID=2866311 RepID=UPI001C7377F1|nr:DUF58 domain-containing protein [Ruficoccus sp. ZRK36]QYY35101.1 DUF58 domain-containing protein [Ruficoccus sp. ZRK36]